VARKKKGTGGEVIRVQPKISIAELKGRKKERKEGEREDEAVTRYDAHFRCRAKGNRKIGNLNHLSSRMRSRAKKRKKRNKGDVNISSLLESIRV